jgi:hypothetical protein
VFLRESPSIPTATRALAIRGISHRPLFGLVSTRFWFAPMGLQERRSHLKSFLQLTAFPFRFPQVRSRAQRRTILMRSLVRGSRLCLLALFMADYLHTYCWLQAMNEANLI